MCTTQRVHSKIRSQKAQRPPTKKHKGQNKFRRTFHTLCFLWQLFLCLFVAQGFLTLCVERTRPGESGPRASSAVTLPSRTESVKRPPCELPCSTSSTRAGLPFRTATSFALVYSTQSPVPFLLGCVKTTLRCAIVFSISLLSFRR